jgi:hypothetical protein
MPLPIEDGWVIEARVASTTLLAAVHMPSALCGANVQNSHLLKTQSQI